MLSRSVLLRTGVRLSRASNGLCEFVLNPYKSTVSLPRSTFQSANLSIIHGKNLLSGSDACNNKRLYCSSVEIPVAEYNEIKDLPNHPEKLLIDVREADELVKYGKIPTSINIPFRATKRAFTLPEKYFKIRYVKSKPSLDCCIIFLSQLGDLPQDAAILTMKLDYKNVKNYRGSWVDWAEREGIPIPQ